MSNFTFNMSEFGYGNVIENGSGTSPSLFSFNKYNTGDVLTIKIRPYEHGAEYKHKYNPNEKFAIYRKYGVHTGNILCHGNNCKNCANYWTAVNHVKNVMPKAKDNFQLVMGDANVIKYKRTEYLLFNAEIIDDAAFPENNGKMIVIKGNYKFVNEIEKKEYSISALINDNDNSIYFDIVFDKSVDGKFVYVSSIEQKTGHTGCKSSFGIYELDALLDEMYITVKDADIKKFDPTGSNKEHAGVTVTHDFGVDDGFTFTEEGTSNFEDDIPF